MLKKWIKHWLGLDVLEETQVALNEVLMDGEQEETEEAVNYLLMKG